MIKYIDQVKLKGKRILLRLDFNVSFANDSIHIADDVRMRQALPTINYLLKNDNKLIIVSHLGRPKKRDPRFSLKMVAKHLHRLLPKYEVILVDDFQNSADKKYFTQQTSKQILMLENIRFYEGEAKGCSDFAKELTQLADVYVNDAFGVAHRSSASIICPPRFMPAYAGLLMKKEIFMIDKLTKHPKKPLVAVVGGSKVSTKIHVINRLGKIADYLLVGGRMANTFLVAEGHDLGKSLYDYEDLDKARRLLHHFKNGKAKIILPVDVVVGLPDVEDVPGEVRALSDVPLNKLILDIGPATQALFATYIARAKTIIWNGPVGYFENANYRNGTDFIYYTIAHNQEAESLVGGGDTLAAISKKEFLNKITHLSTGGGAMLEYIEKGILPGIEALK